MFTNKLNEGVIVDNYKFSKTFEKLAIKIVDKHYLMDVDHGNSHVTKATRDYGVDAIIHIKNDSWGESHTIEAKLRKPEATLAVKDIASSILFYLIRHGAHHYVVTNVYLTDGTIDAIEKLNISNTNNIHYIDGEDTKKTLEVILPELLDDEAALAQEIISNFKQLKRPKSEKIRNQSKIEDFHEKIYQSREKVIHNLIEDIQGPYDLIILQGPQGVGKRFIMKQLERELTNPHYRFLKIDTQLQNTLPLICYEIATQILGIKVYEIFENIGNEDKTNFQPHFEESEQKILELLLTAFDPAATTMANGFYIASEFLKLLFEKNNETYYVIVIENLSEATQEVYNFLINVPRLLSHNAVFVGITNSNISSRFRGLPLEYHLANAGKIITEKLGYMEAKEAVEYINSLTAERTVTAQLLYDNVGGNPLVLREYASHLKKNSSHKVFDAGYVLNVGLDLENIYKSRILMYLKGNDYFKKFLLIVFLNSGKITHTLLTQLGKLGYIGDDEYKNYEVYLEETGLFTKNITYWTIKVTYIDSLIEKIIWESKNDYVLLAEKYVEIMENLKLATHNVINLLYIANNERLIETYEKYKGSWEFRTNLDWNKQALRCIGYYLLEQENHSLERIILKISYYLDYLECSLSDISIDETIYSNLNKEIEVIEANFHHIDKDSKETIAKEIGRYYLWFYQDKRRKVEKGTLQTLFKEAFESNWFPLLGEKEKIIFYRYNALIHKETYGRKDFDTMLEEVFNSFPSNPYAKTVYWANKAPLYYISNPQKAIEYIEMCPLEDLKKVYPEELAASLWVENDLAIAYFYNKRYDAAKKTAKKALSQSKKINYRENKSRSYNILGLISLSGKDKEKSISLFHKALTESVAVNADAFLHFAINYLTVTQILNAELVDYVMNFFKKNHSKILQLYTQRELSSKRWFISLKAFANFLKNNHIINYQEIYILYEDIIKDSVVIDDKCKVNQELYILF